ncbi:apolipoprotein D and lipocalin family protein [Acinetobacter marinus]|uniref:Outer membrane lipoprotein Blc n=2 Tax=Acinetobacter marinus TaxID=281375 RepID=A0A1G6LDA8_9GAMM|nr:apolipoprotein D and lipocalin family protein [Acinetobacter marinus]
MTKNKKIWLTAVALTGLAVWVNVAQAKSSAMQTPTTAQPKAVDAIDVQKYLGTWYEVARLPMYFQRNCASDVQAEYSLNADQTIQVKNQCINTDGKLDVSEGVAYSQNDGNSQLKVSFLPKGLRWVPFSKGDYWVLRVDEDYQVALVGGPSHRYLWLLSRTPDVDEAVIEDYLNTAKAQGYDLSTLIRTKHSAEK